VSSREYSDDAACVAAVLISIDALPSSIVRCSMDETGKRETVTRRRHARHKSARDDLMA
jgi:hypothetical protein